MSAEIRAWFEDYQWKLCKEDDEHGDSGASP